MRPDRGLSRRDLMLLGGAGVVGYYGLSGGPSSSSASGTTSTFGSGLRWQRLRPVVGGSSLGIEASDEVGSAAVGVEGPNGEPWIVTCRHVVDPEYPDSEESDVVGTDVYQPDSGDDAPVGSVVDVGESKGPGATDWAVVELADAADWTAYTVGLGPVGDRYEPSRGDRLVLGGLRTGIHGVEVTATGLQAKWRGVFMSDLIEYRVDDEADTAGNSGGWLGRLDVDTGTSRPAGIHTFRNEEYRYAVPVSQCVDEPGGSLVGSPADRPTVPTLDGPRVEGALADVAASARCKVANVGDSTATDRVVRVLADGGEEIDRTTVTLDPLDHTEVMLDAPSDGPATLDTGDETVEEVQP